MQFTSGLYNVLLIKQFVKLGRRMIPLARSKIRAAASSKVTQAQYESTSSDVSRTTDSIDQENASSANENIDSVSREDGFLRAAIVTRFVAEVVNVCMTTLFQSLSPRSSYDAFVSAFFALSVCFIASTVIDTID